VTKTEMATAMAAQIRKADPVLPGSEKRYIADIWASAEELLEAARMGIVELSRCDLPAAYDADRVAASELRYLNATFHFVRMTRA